MSVQNFNEHRVTPDDRQWVTEVFIRFWKADYIVTRGRIHFANDLEGTILSDESGERLGLVTWRIEGAECEIVTVNSLREGARIGSALIHLAILEAEKAHCRRVLLITTNDNTKALHLYQKMGFRLKAVYPNAIEESRRLKPQIPLLGDDDIPIRDEIELEILLPTIPESPLMLVTDN